jgi:hypothetical protein
MKKWIILLGFAALCLAPGAGAQTLLSNLSLSGSVTASATAVDYRYTKHTRGGSGRGGGYRSTTYYTWDPHTDEQISPSLAMVLNGSLGTATATGIFYTPTYSATASGTTSVSSSDISASFTTTYNASTTINTPPVAHQRVTANTQANSTFYFTLTDFADVTVTATGSANGALALYGQLDEGVGVILGSNGAGTATATLGPGSYWIVSSTGGSAGQDTQLNTSLNLGTTDAGYSFTVTFSKQSGGN